MSGAVLATAEPLVVVSHDLNARHIPKAAAEVGRGEACMIGFCRSRKFSPGKLRYVLSESYRWKR